MKEGELYKVIIVGGLPTSLGSVAQGDIVMCLGHGKGLNILFLTKFGVTQREIPLACLPHWLQRVK